MLKEVSIEIIRKCPNNCVHCSSMSDEYCTEIFEYQKFIQVIDDAAKLGAKTICLSGGEPFLHPDIINMISYASKIGLDCYVYTSGIVFDGSMNRASLTQDFLRLIVGTVSKLIFNIEAATADTYDRIMGTTGCFELMKQSVLNANSLSIATEAHFVPMKLNIDEIESVITLCKNLGITKISFLRLVPHGRAVINEESIVLSDDELLDLKNMLESLKNNAGIDIRIGVPLSKDYSCHKCEAADGKLNIKYDGHVFPCEVFKNDRMAMQSNGLDTESIYNMSLMDIYNKSSFLHYVRKLSHKFSCERHCETCIGQYLINYYKRSN